MKTKLAIVCAALAGLSVGIPGGIAGGIAIRAQQAKTPPGYVIAEVNITDLSTFEKYGEQVPGTLAPFNHHYVVRGNKYQSLEGEPPTGGVVIIAFDSVEKAREWYYSPAYAAIRPIRQSSAKSRIYIVEGLAATP